MCHWNVNSVSFHNFSKLHFLAAYKCAHKFEITCLSESFINNETPLNDDNLENTETIFTADHSSNRKNNSMCLYYKASLHLENVDISYFQEFIHFEVKIRDETCNFIIISISKPNKGWIWIIYSKILNSTWNTHIIN